MPARNGTGPLGMGPMTGRGMGPCGLGAGFAGRPWGYGYGYGYGYPAYGRPFGGMPWGGFGRGRGRWFSRGRWY
jgi:hypothetical protein